MRKFAATIVLTGAFSLLAAAESGLTLIRPDAGFVVGFEWRKVVDSQAGIALTEQLKKTELPPIPGLEGLRSSFLNDLDSVVIAGSTATLSTGQQPPALVVVKGRFNLAQLRSMIPTKEQNVEQYRSVDLLIIPDSKPTPGSTVPPIKNRLVFLDESTILLGERSEVRAAIDRVKTGRLTAARSDLAKLASQHEIWMSFELPANALKSAPPAAAQMFSSVKSADLGMSFQQGLGVQMNIRTTDAASAKTVAQALQGLIAMAAMSQTESKPGADVLKRVQITPENSSVKLAMVLDKSEFDQMVKDAQSSRTVASSAGRSAPGFPASKPPEPAGPKTIRITGLASGPVEVPLASAQK